MEPLKHNTFLERNDHTCFLEVRFKDGSYFEEPAKKNHLRVAKGP